MTRGATRGPRGSGGTRGRAQEREAEGQEASGRTEQDKQAPVCFRPTGLHERVVFLFEKPICPRAHLPNLCQNMVSPRPPRSDPSASPLSRMPGAQHSPERGLGCGGCAHVHEARGCTCEVAGTLCKAGRHVQDHQEPPGPLRRGQRKQQKPRLTAQNSCPCWQGLCLLAFCYSSLVQLFVYHINEKLMNTRLRTALGTPMGAQDSRSFWKVRSFHRSDSTGRNRPSA